MLSEEYFSERAIVIYLQDENEEVYIIKQALPQIIGGNLADIDLELAPAHIEDSKQAFFTSSDWLGVWKYYAKD